MPAPILLVQHGVFPATPTRPRTAVSIDLLVLYRSLFERSCDAITALAAALHTTYTRRGFRIYSRRDSGVHAVDPFRKALSGAVLWASHLQTRLQARLAACLADPAASQHPVPPPIQPAPPPTTQPAPSCPPPPLTQGRADQTLRDRCPACFGLETWGRPLKEGGDVQLGADGCFSYRHLKSAGDGPISYTPDYFIPKAKIESIRARIASVRKSPPATYTPKIPQDVLDACETSWEAANEKKRKADPQRYDASGVFVVTCRHSQVLFMCNIDTPGKQQAYVIACIETIASLLPPSATILQTYDVGCVADHSLNLFPILSPGLRERISFCINVMYAFGHQWVCQLVYNPRMHRGCGLTDGEGVERIWSRIRKLIPLTRNQWNSRRIWMIDTYISFVNEEGLENLGSWLQRQEERNLAPKLVAAQRVLRECRVPEWELRREWAAQKEMQTSVRAHAPARLKRELDKVLALQVQIDTVETSILEVKASVTAGDATTETNAILSRLQTTHQKLGEQAEALYASLNIAHTFPELQGLPLEFVRTLLLMRDLKINIRKRAVGSFYEWETLDRAVSGRREALGTKLHQATRKAITRWQPALIKAIAKYNAYCEKLNSLRPPGCQIPVPALLSTRLNGLRDDPTLHEDVWIEQSGGPIPCWLDDCDVRDGICSLHILDRCIEEAARLNLERANLDRWLTEELAVVEKAREANDPVLCLLLEERREGLQHMRSVWTPALRVRRQPTVAIPFAAIPASRAAAEDDEEAASRAAAEDDEDVGFNAPDSTDIVSSEELDLGLISDAEAPLELESLLEGQHELEDTTDINVLPFKLCWEPPVISGSQTRTRAPPAYFYRRGWQAPQSRHHIDGLDGLLGHARLNNFCVNDVAAAMHAYFTRPDSPIRRTAADCAVFSTFELVRTRYKASDVELLKAVRRTQYSEKSTWLVPIHRPDEEHWVLAVVAVAQQQIFIFDSFASKEGWHRDLSSRLVALAQRNDNLMNIDLDVSASGAWDVNPVFTPGRRRQTNGYDCSVWVLCTMAAFMRGCCATEVAEGDMPSARRLLRNYMLSLDVDDSVS
ncbi:hypothetical protein C8R45DRAFT_841653 [Mycena sanguinolenta]|nr:hypothetical protein C8R45DRAFT_841653 [Mycena sanguinolenta]